MSRAASITEIPVPPALVTDVVPAEKVALLPLDIPITRVAPKSPAFIAVNLISADEAPCATVKTESKRVLLPSVEVNPLVLNSVMRLAAVDAFTSAALDS